MRSWPGLKSVIVSALGLLSRRKNELIGARTAGQRVVGAGRENDVLAGCAVQGDGPLSGLVEHEMDRVGMAETVGDGQRHHVGLRWMLPGS